MAKSFSVMAGDEVSGSVWVKYMKLSGTSNTNVLLASLANAFGGVSGGGGESGKIYTGLNSFAGTVPLGDHPGDDEGAPKAFVTILFFDKNYNFLDATWDQVSTTGAQTSPSVKQPPHDLVTVTAKAPDNGYAFVFLSNEHSTLVDVYFDDVTFSHTPGPIVSSSDYYPFGLAFNSASRSTTPLQNYTYNGKELQDELSLGWLDYGARMYNAEVGRWFGVDPLADISRRWSPYAYALDNPVRFIDPDGMAARDNQEEHRAWMDARGERSARRRNGSNGMGVAENVVFDYSKDQQKPENTKAQIEPKPSKKPKAMDIWKKDKHKTFEELIQHLRYLGHTSQEPSTTHLADIVLSFDEPVGVWEGIAGALGFGGDNSEQRGIDKMFGAPVEWSINVAGNPNTDAWKTSKANMHLSMTGRMIPGRDFVTGRPADIYQIQVWGGGDPSPKLIYLNFLNKEAFNKAYNYLTK